ncbi:MAG TPA: ROK family protein [bacterium]|nr:ROK family protein [bacterium]HPL95418.1 ROK family protein [bacterium]
MSYSIALDIGATKTLGAIIKNNRILKKIKQPTQAKTNKNNILKNIKKIIKELMARPEIAHDVLKKIGVGFAGQIDQKKGLVLGTGNFVKSFKNIKLAEILESEFKVKVAIDNDVHCFVLAESQRGAGVGIKNLVGLTLGTGIGGGILNQGVLWRGLNNTAGEVGNMKIAGQWIGPAPICGCGQKYCFESMASGNAWHKINKKYGAKKADQIIIYNIVTGLINLCYILNPEMLILGGGLMEHPGLLKKIKNEFLIRAEETWFRQVKIVLPKLGDEAILMGSLMN